MSEGYVLVKDTFVSPMTNGEIQWRYHEATVEIIQAFYSTDVIKRIFVPYAILDMVMEQSKR